jgi:hypothetical protein
VCVCVNLGARDVDVGVGGGWCVCDAPLRAYVCGFRVWGLGLGFGV